VLDIFITKIKWLALIGSVGYDIALWLNRVYNLYREKRKLPYYSISKEIKNRIKSAVSFVNDFEDNAVKLAKLKNCDIAVCGHIHQPDLKENYMNSGDWCENCTALVETLDGKWEIFYFHK
jgi:UDP-2,3-diacylglucosamine pyrophosphatase LpxH